MHVRGQFYAFVLMVLCLTINVAFFPEVREPFLGDEDPTASVKSALNDWDIPAKLAEFYPKIQMKAADMQDEVRNERPLPELSKPELPKAEKPAPKEQRRQSPVLPASPEASQEIVDPFLQPSASPPKETGTPKPVDSPVVPVETLPTAATVLRSAPATVQPAFADQFKPIMGK